MRAKRALLKQFLRRFARDDSGATAIEYCMIAVFISIVCVTVWTQMGTRLVVLYTSIIPGLNR
jgi:pilus assembly protein Flp/PilA